MASEDEIKDIGPNSPASPPPPGSSVSRVTVDYKDVFKGTPALVEPGDRVAIFGTGLNKFTEVIVTDTRDRLYRIKLPRRTTEKEDGLIAFEFPKYSEENFRFSLWLESPDPAVPSLHPEYEFEFTLHRETEKEKKSKKEPERRQKEAEYEAKMAQGPVFDPTALVMGSGMDALKSVTSSILNSGGENKGPAAPEINPKNLPRAKNESLGLPPVMEEDSAPVDYPKDKPGEGVELGGRFIPPPLMNNLSASASDGVQTALSAAAEAVEKAKEGFTHAGDTEKTAFPQKAGVSGGTSELPSPSMRPAGFAAPVSNTSFSGSASLPSASHGISPPEGFSAALGAMPENAGGPGAFLGETGAAEESGGAPAATSSVFPPLGEGDLSDTGRQKGEKNPKTQSLEEKRGRFESKNPPPEFAATEPLAPSPAGVPTVPLPHTGTSSGPDKPYGRAAGDISSPEGFAAASGILPNDSAARYGPSGQDGTIKFQNAPGREGQNGSGISPENGQREKAKGSGQPEYETSRPDAHDPAVEFKSLRQENSLPHKEVKREKGKEQGQKNAAEPVSVSEAGEAKFRTAAAGGGFSDKPVSSVIADSAVSSASPKPEEVSSVLSGTLAATARKEQSDEGELSFVGARVNQAHAEGEMELSGRRQNARPGLAASAETQADVLPSVLKSAGVPGRAAEGEGMSVKVAVSESRRKAADTSAGSENAGVFVREKNFPESAAGPNFSAKGNMPAVPASATAVAEGVFPKVSGQTDGSAQSQGQNSFSAPGPVPGMTFGLKEKSRAGEKVSESPGVKQPAMARQPQPETARQNGLASTGAAPQQNTVAAPTPGSSSSAGTMDGSASSIRAEASVAAQAAIEAVASRLVDPGETKSVKEIIKEELAARGTIANWSPTLAKQIGDQVGEMQAGLAEARETVSQVKKGLIGLDQAQKAIKDGKLGPAVKQKLGELLKDRLSKEAGNLPPSARDLIGRARQAGLQSGKPHERAGRVLDLAQNASKTLGKTKLAERIGKTQTVLSGVSPHLDALYEPTAKQRAEASGKVLTKDEKFISRTQKAQKVLRAAEEAARLTGQKDLESLFKEMGGVAEIEDGEDASYIREKFSEKVGERFQEKIARGELQELLKKGGQYIAREIEKHPGLARQFGSNLTGKLAGGAAARLAGTKLGQGAAKLGEAGAKIGSKAASSMNSRLAGAAAGGAISAALQGEGKKGMAQSALSWMVIEFFIVDVWVPLQGLMALAYLDFHWLVSLTGNKWFRKPSVFQRITIFFANFYHIGIMGLILFLVLFFVCNNPVYYAITWFTGQSQVCKYMDTSNFSTYIASKVASNATGSFTCAGQMCTNQWDDRIKAYSSQANIDACILKTVIEKETHGNPNAIGHDSHNRNADPFQPQNPPRYGLNWDYSHGIGLTQWTIFPERAGNPWVNPATPSRFMNGRFYTVEDFLNPELSLNLTAQTFARNLNANGNNLKKAFGDYNGSGQNGQYAADAMRLYDLCKGLNVFQ